MAAAQISGCTVLLTEDLSHDQELVGVRIMDPFRVEPDSLRAQ